MRRAWLRVPGTTVGWTGLAALLLPASALAHPAPAEPPAFHEDACIVVVDKRAQDSWHLTYAVPVEDTEPDPDLIALPDTKTHQFMAMAGTVFTRAMRHGIIAFDDPTATARALPQWLDDADVMRAASAEEAWELGFSAAQVTDADVLERNPMLAAQVWPFADDPARVPITAEQGMRGVDWPLADVPPGGYQIVAYIFSPPYNGWAARPGLVKVVDGEQDPAVITLDDIAGNVFGGQGRRITGCVDAPEGSTLQVAVRQRNASMGAFEPWLQDLPIDGLHFDACLPNPGLDASLEVRVEVRTPAGESAAVHSGGAITMFSNEAACQPSDVICCDGVPPDDAAPMGPGKQGPGKQDGARSPGTDTPLDGVPSGGAGAHDGGVAADAGQRVSPSEHAAVGDGACSAGSSPPACCTWPWLGALAWLTTRCRSRQSRHSRSPSRKRR